MQNNYGYQSSTDITNTAIVPSRRQRPQTAHIRKETSRDADLEAFGTNDYLDTANYASFVPL